MSYPPAAHARCSSLRANTWILLFAAQLLATNARAEVDEPGRRPETQPAATQPAATQPATSRPAATRPAATQPAKARSEPAARTAPAETRPAPHVRDRTETAVPRASAAAEPGEKQPAPGPVVRLRKPQSRPLATDRPGSGFAPTTVAPLRFQVETGVQFRNDDSSGTTTRRIGFPTGLRLGILSWLEVRLNTDIFAIRTQTSTDTIVGPTDITFGFKAQLLRQLNVAVPNIALIAQLSVPSGFKDLSSNGVDPGFLLLAGWDLPLGFGALLMGGAKMTHGGVGDRPYGRATYLGLIRYGLPFWERRIHLFVDIYGQPALDDAFESRLQAEFGSWVLLTNNMQIDVYSQVGLTQETDDFSLSVGFSYRL